MITGNLYVPNNDFYQDMPEAKVSILPNDIENINLLWISFKREDKDKTFFLYLGDVMWYKNKCLKLLYKDKILIFNKNFSHFLERKGCVV